MHDFLRDLFDRSAFAASSHADGWTADLLRLHNAADALLWLACLAVPVALLSCARRHRDRPFPWAGWAVAAFLIGCGTTHLMDLITAHAPVYRLSGVVRLVAAVLAWSGALVLIPLMPRLLRLRNPDALEREIAGRLQAQAALARMAQCNELILNAAGQGICGLDLEGAITFFNLAAARMTGWGPEGLHGRRAGEVLRLTRGDGTLYPPGACPVRAALCDGSVHRADDDLFWRRDGQPLPVEYIITPIRENGRIAGAVITFSDSTQRKRVEEALRRARGELESRVQQRTAELSQANALLQEQIRERQRFTQERIDLLGREQAAREEAEAANRTKDEFLATLSHELRTPLNSMLGWARILRNDQLDRATFRRGLETIERNVRVQTQLINDLLDVSRIITGKLRLEVGRIELTSIVESAIDAVRPAVDAKAIRLEVVLERAAGAVSADADRLQQVVWNLLANAIKFTPRAGRVQVRLRRAGAHVEIAVSDSGEGIDAEFLPHVFDRFRQADSTITRPHTGLGLGLAIVRHLVELHGGTVHVTSPGRDQGATFTVRLPVAALPELAAHGPAPAIPDTGGVDLDGLRVLIVDDDADVRELVTLVLERCGAEVASASSTRDALEAIDWIKPDVLVSDIGMPGEDGYTLLRKARVLGARHGLTLPAVALTAYAKAEDRNLALAAGFEIHLSKPVEPTDLAAAVATVAGRSVASCSPPP